MAQCPKPKPKRGSVESMWRRLYTHAGHKSRKRGKEWKLSFEDYMEIIQMQCHYCDAEPGNSVDKAMDLGRLDPRRRDYKYQGIDRIDSSKGYTRDNVLPCCWMCNKMKGTSTTGEILCHLRKMLPRLADLVVINLRIRSLLNALEDQSESESETTD